MYIDKYGNHWYKGNLHTHTTISDGAKTPEDTKSAYRAMGYDFIALTDHWKPGAWEEQDSSGLLVLSGAEYDVGRNDVLNGVYHIVGFGYEEPPALTRENAAQEIIDAINAAGGLAILAHPAWSLNTHDQVSKLSGLFATEIYNSVSGFPRNCRPYSGQVIDELAARGYYLPLIATDDTHFWLGEAGMSYIWVNLGDAPLNRANLMKALRDGKFFPSQGPFIHAHIEEKTLVVECETGAAAMTMYSNRPWAGVRRFEDGEGRLTECRFPIDKADTFMRVEVADNSGKLAFTQVFPIAHS
ncbi:MAG: hypothetical protein E7632_01670 [Ruminococcaceae bacterium]|nr:hypothetical protein [Oscillospiraceae bacterium]